MDVNGIGNAAGTGYQYAGRTREKTVNETSFAESLNKMEETGKASAKQSAEMFPGDVVINYPLNLTSNSYANDSLAGKSKEEMSLDEYKQWVMSQISGYPVSGWVRSTFSSGAVVIKEEAFERMKEDPEYEKYVMNRVRSNFSAKGFPVGNQNVSYDVIGASPEECYGYAGPVGNSGLEDSLSNGKSWWEKRHEKLEEILAEQEKKAQNKRAARREQILQKWEQQTFESRRKATEVFNRRAMGASQITGKEISEQIAASVITAYGKSITGTWGDGGSH